MITLKKLRIISDINSQFKVSKGCNRSFQDLLFIRFLEILVQIYSHLSKEYISKSHNQD